jgi:hypothetical protein
MINQFSTDYPLWMLILPIVTGLVFSAFLYFSPLKKGRKNKLGKGIRYVLFVFRFLSVSLISLLLLNPFIKTSKKNIRKPKLIVAIDNSSSILLSADSVNIKKNIESDILELNNRYSSDYDVETLLFGEKISFGKPNFKDSYSNYSQLFKYIDNQYPAKQIEALVVIGDGIYNRGTNPLVLNKSPFKTISVGVGDTSSRADIKINDISYNSINYLNENIPLELNFSAGKMQGETVSIEAYNKGKLLDSRNIHIKEKKINKTIKFDFKAVETGKMHLSFVLKVNKEEYNNSNNHADVYIDILNSRQKILILANSPHPDLSALKRSIENFKNYQVDIRFADEKIKNINSYSLVIMHQLPSRKHKVPGILKQVKELNMATLAIVGPQTDFASLRSYYSNSGIKSSIRGYDKSTALINKKFPYFKINSTDIQLIESLPPLNIPLTNFDGIESSTVLAWQKINDIKTNFPLIYFMNKGETKNSLIMGTGLWNWRNYNYLENENFESFDNLMGKIVQYLSLKTDKRRFRIHNKGEYLLPDNIELEAELYNKSFESIPDAEIDLELINEESEHFTYIFTPEDGAYKLNIGDLLAGTYKYKAKTEYNNEVFYDKGEFIIKRNKLEFLQAKANYNLLFKLADNNNGLFAELKDISSVYSFIDNLNAKKRVSYSISYKGLNNIPVILILILTLLCVEWFIRKYMGSY